MRSLNASMSSSGSSSSGRWFPRQYQGFVASKSHARALTAAPACGKLILPRFSEALTLRLSPRGISLSVNGGATFGPPLLFWDSGRVVSPILAHLVAEVLQGDSTRRIAALTDRVDPLLSLPYLLYNPEIVTAAEWACGLVVVHFRVFRLATEGGVP
jgi:hypothetical protein